VKAWLVVLLLASGCGGSQQQNVETALDVSAVAVDSANTVMLAYCDTKAQAIVDRQGTTKEDDERDYGELKSACNQFFDATEAIRTAHDSLRALDD
jgi:hypothetical protein